MSEMIVEFHQDERGIARSWDEVGKLIRCKDCKWYDVGMGECDHKYGLMVAYEDSFCSLAERRGLC